MDGEGPEGVISRGATARSKIKRPPGGAPMVAVLPHYPESQTFRYESISVWTLNRNQDRHSRIQYYSITLNTGRLSSRHNIHFVRFTRTYLFLIRFKIIIKKKHILNYKKLQKKLYYLIFDYGTLIDAIPRRNPQILK